MLHSNAPDVDKYVATSGPFRNKPRQSRAGLCRINRIRELRRRMIPIIACRFSGHLLKQKRAAITLPLFRSALRYDRQTNDCAIVQPCPESPVRWDYPQVARSAKRLCRWCPVPWCSVRRADCAHRPFRWCRFPVKPSQHPAPTTRRRCRATAVVRPAYQ